MAISSLSMLGAAASSGAPFIEYVNTSASGIRVLEVHVQAAQASPQLTYYGLGRPATAGVGMTGAVTAIRDDPADPASGLQAGIAWVGAPTAPAQFLCRYTHSSGATSIGAGMSFTFPKDGLVIPPSKTLVWWCINGSAMAPTFTIVVDE